MINLQKFGQIIASERLARNLTQAKLSKILLVTPQAISKWERGESFPDIETLVELCVTFDISIDFLLNECFDSFNLVDDLCPDNIEEYLRSSQRKEIIDKLLTGELTPLCIDAVFYLLRTHERLLFLEKAIAGELNIEMNNFIILLNPPERIKLIDGLLKTDFDIASISYLLNPMEKNKYNLI